MTEHGTQRPTPPGQRPRLTATVRQGLRLLGAGLLCLVLLGILTANTARAVNVYSDYFIRLSARPLAMGGANTALTGPAAVYSNPAALAGVRDLTLLYNHSARHFPGSQEGGKNEWDQLDGDTEAIVVPLPLSTYAHGFTFSNEMGYDYRWHPADNSLGYPRGRYTGSEDYDAWATSLGLPCALGVALRRSNGRYTPPADSGSPAWFRRGEGMQWGVLARVWPGLDYGMSNLELDYEWTVLEDPGSGPTALGTFDSRHKTGRSGWALHPAGWLTLTSDRVNEEHIFDRGNDLGINETVGLGRIHLGNAERATMHRGAELSLGALAKLRWGDYDGHATWGCALNFGGLWLNYTEVQDLLPEIIGGGQGYEDLHFYGFELQLR